MKRLAGWGILYAIALSILFIANKTIGHQLFTSWYHGSSIGIIDNIFEFFRTRPLERHLQIADTLFFVFFLGVLPWVLLYFSSYKKLLYQSIINGPWLEKHTQFVDSLPKSHIGLWIALSAGLGLFIELMIIRIHSSYFQFFAYFKNVSLLSCFLGLGVGYAFRDKNPLKLPLVFPFLAAQIITLYILRFTQMGMSLQNPIVEEYTLGMGQVYGILGIVFVYFFLVLVFVLNALAFVPLGHLTGRLMQKQSNLVAYSWNLLGSLLGIVLFSFISFIWAPPKVWIILAAVGLIMFYWNDKRSMLITGLTLCLVLIVQSVPFSLKKFDVFSPYQILSLSVAQDGLLSIETSNAYYQKLLNLKDSTELNKKNYHYQLPYFFKKKPKNVLVVGAGTGNDVAAAVRNGAGHIDAVEIDPAIQQFGRALHPEQPYQAPNVTAYINDARAFMRHTKQQYDLIVYGLLDSHTLLANKGGVRLDSYVYTVQAFKEARKLLKKDGLIALSFSILSNSIGKKIFLMIQEAFDGKEPLVIRSGYDDGFFYIIGENFSREQVESTEILDKPYIKGVSDIFKNERIKADISTDDWPFLYMPVRRYPFSYIIMVTLLLSTSFVFISKLIPQSTRGVSWTAFFLGAGFMLLETKAITELALVFGSTWFVISAVIAAIMIMAFLANLYIIKKGALPTGITYGFLILTLLMGFLVTFVSSEEWPVWFSQLFYTVLLTIPLFFSGFAFSAELKKSIPVGTILASNLIGAMLGGLLEYNSMYFGFRSLYLLAIVMYVLAFLATTSKRKVI